MNPDKECDLQKRAVGMYVGETWTLTSEVATYILSVPN
jgi:hypothetical protein